MKQSIFYAVAIFTTLAIGALTTTPVQAQTQTTINNNANANSAACPTGFYPALTNVCVASKLSSNTVTPLSSTNGCPSAYEHTPGTQFCSLPNVALTWEDERYLVTGPIQNACPDNFSRAPGTRVCIADHLSLALVDNTLTLLAPTLVCPEGFEQLPAAPICTAIATSGSQATDPSIVMPDCAPGFIRPPHVHFCIAYTVARNTSERVNFGITPPTGDCPRFWTKNTIGGFCVPLSTAVTCGPGSFPCTHRPGDKVAVLDDPECCPSGSAVIIGHMPGFNGVGPLELTSKPIVMCLPPGEGEHLDCEGLDIFHMSN